MIVRAIRRHPTLEAARRHVRNMLTTSIFIGSVLVLLSAAALCPVSRAVATDTHFVVPADASLSISRYCDLGIPEPSKPWTAADYLHALRVLGELPRTQLPRASGPSQLMFDRLLISYRNEFDLPDGDGDAKYPAGESTPNNLPILYSPNQQDVFLFDNELIAIRAEELSRTLAGPTREALLRWRSALRSK